MPMINKEWKEFYRSSLFIITAAFIILSAWFVLFQYQGMEEQIQFRTSIVSMFQLSVYFLPLLAMIYGGFSILSEKNQQTLAILVSRGLTIRRFIYTKCLTLFAVFLPVTLISYFIGIIPAKIVTEKLVPSELLLFLFAVLAVSIVFLGLGMMLGSLMQHNFKFIGVVISVWLFFVYLYDLVLMFWLPYVSLDYVFLFSIFYFLSPIHAVQYFLLVKLNIYQLSDLSVIYDQFTFQSPWIVLIANILFWLVLSLGISIYVLKRKGVTRA